MASQNSASSSHSSGGGVYGRGPLIKCHHQEVAPLRVVKHNGPNLGMRFYGCSYWPRTCGFFMPADDVNEVRDLQSRVLEKDTRIALLEHQLEEVQEKVESLKNEKTMLQDELLKTNTECNERKLIIEQFVAAKRVRCALVLSWVFFAIMLWMY